MSPNKVFSSKYPTPMEIFIESESGLEKRLRFLFPKRFLLTLTLLKVGAKEQGGRKAVQES